MKNGFLRGFFNFGRHLGFYLGQHPEFLFYMSKLSCKAIKLNFTLKASEITQENALLP